MAFGEHQFGHSSRGVALLKVGETGGDVTLWMHFKNDSTLSRWHRNRHSPSWQDKGSPVRPRPHRWAGNAFTRISPGFNFRIDHGEILWGGVFYEGGAFWLKGNALRCTVCRQSTVIGR